MNQMVWAFNRHLPNPGMKFVLISITHLGVPSQPMIVELTGMGARTVNRHIKDLEKLKLIQKFRQNGELHYTPQLPNNETFASAAEIESPKRRKRIAKSAPLFGQIGAHAERPKDDAFEVFKAKFEAARAPAKYLIKKHDFIKLTELRKAYGVEHRGVPVGWESACDNYLASHLRIVTMADLCARYDVFLMGPVDKFGQQIGVERESAEQGRVRRTKEAIRDAIDSINREAGPDVGDGDQPGKGITLSRTTRRLN